MNKKINVLLFIIFLLALTTRIIIAFQTPELTYESYFVIRNIENIKQTGLPLFQDELSYGGRTNVFSPLYYYVLTIFSFIIPMNLLLKILPNIFAASIVFVVYLFSKKISGKKESALIAAGASAMIPVLFSKTINNASIYTIVIPLFFLTLYFFLETVKNSKNFWKFLVTLILLVLTHATSLILVLGLIIYVILLKIQGFKQSTKEPEILLFTLLLTLWTNLTIYQKAITTHGISVIYQNIPLQIILDTYKEITFVESLYWIGVIPLLFGVISIYQSVFESKKKSITMLIAVGITFFILLWFKLIDVYVGLMFLGVSTSILASRSIQTTLNQATNTKFKLAKKTAIIIITSLILLSFIPSVNYALQEASNVPVQEDKDALNWLATNTDENATILTSPEEGNLLSYYTKRRNAIDTNFLLINNIDLRYHETKRIYHDRFLIPALTKLNYYTIDYVLVSRKTQEKENISKLFYEDKDCIQEVYKKNQVKIYSVNCLIALDK